MSITCYCCGGPIKMTWRDPAFITSEEELVHRACYEEMEGHPPDEREGQVTQFWWWVYRILFFWRRNE